MHVYTYVCMYLSTSLHKNSNLELWRMRSTSLLPSLPGPLWPGVLAPDKGPLYGLNRTAYLRYTEFFELVLFD